MSPHTTAIVSTLALVLFGGALAIGLFTAGYGLIRGVFALLFPEEEW